MRLGLRLWLGIADFDDVGSGQHRVALGHQHLAHISVAVGLNAVLHLHGLQRCHCVALLHAVTGLHIDGGHSSGQRRVDGVASHCLLGCRGCGGLCGSLAAVLGCILFHLFIFEECFGHHWEQLEQQHLLLVGGMFHAASLGQGGVGLHLIFRCVVGRLLAHAAYLHAEVWVNLYRCVAILSLHKTHKLRTLVGVRLAACTLVDGAVHSLGAHDLRRGCHQRRQSRSQAHGRNQLHGARQYLLGAELLELCHHVAVHAARNLGLLHILVGGWEAEVCLYLLACAEQCVEVVALSGLHGGVEEAFNVGRQGVGERVERLGLWLFLAKHRQLKLFANRAQLHIDFCHGLHVHAQVDAQLLAEHIHQLQCRGACAAAKPPAVGVHNVDACHNGGKHRCQAVARGAVGVEVERQIDVLLKQLHQRAHALRRYQARHVLDGDHVAAQRGHLLRLVEEILVGEYRSGVPLALEPVEQRQLGIFGVDGVAHRTVGNAAILLHIFHSRLHIVHIVERVENAHNAQAALNSVAAEAVDNLVGVG